MVKPVPATFAVLAIVAVTMLGCLGPKAGISETQMIYAPPRPSNCSLQLVEVNISDVQFNQTWDVLGYVTLADTAAQDPVAVENRALVAPRVCKLGASHVAIGMNSTTTGPLGGTGSGVTYMALRPKSAAAAAPTADPAAASGW